MRITSVFKRLLGVESGVVESVRFEGDELVAGVRLRAREARRPCCGVCGRRGARYDRGSGRRLWRTLDLGTVPAFIEAEVPRVSCPRHGVTVAAVPWARHDSRFTRSFEDMTAWLATQCSQSAVEDLLGITWRTVVRIGGRVMKERDEGDQRFDGLRRIGIDEFSHRKGHRYLTVVVDHDTGRLLWAARGFTKDSIQPFFDRLGPKRCAELELVSADAAAVIRSVVKDNCPNAKLCMDPFHVVTWATEALDEVRREVQREAVERGFEDDMRSLKRSRYVLLKNPENLTDNQAAKLSVIAERNKPIYRAYLLKEQLRQVFRVAPNAAIKLLKGWLAWAQRCRLEPFVRVGSRVRRHLEAIKDALRSGLSNGRVEALNQRMRLIMRRAFGFHTPEALIALAMLQLGGLCPPLPGRPLSRCILF